MLCACLVWACDASDSSRPFTSRTEQSDPEGAPTRPSPDPSGPKPSEAWPSTAPAESKLPRYSAARCQEEIAAASKQPGYPGTPRLERSRVALLTALKAQPVLFDRAAEYTPSTDPVVLAFRRWWNKSPHPGGVLQKLIDTKPPSPELLRDVALRDGYLYADDLAHAEALVRLLRAETLFTQPEIWIQRGEELLTARLHANQYRYTNGPLEGQPVALVLFDRIGAGAVPPALHVDVRALRHRLGFERLSLLHAGEHALVARLHYGPHEVLSLLARNDAHLELKCEVAPPPQEAQALEAWRAERREFNAAFASVQAAIALQVRDGLPFDEPVHEVGQQDGKLRPSWLRAHERNWDAFRFNDDVYPVFGAEGQPLVPEVCVDFLLDTFERAAGTWWSPKGAPRERRIGKLDFDIHDRDRLRRVPEFVQFAQSRPDWFDVKAVSQRQQVPMGSRHFVDYLARNTSDFVPGDVVLIGGYVPWDERLYVHYHSFFIYESDPVSGVPISIAGNPGRPRQVTWTWEAKRTPRRTIRYRIRPRAKWLSSIVQQESYHPPPLVLTSPWAFGQ